MKRENVHIAIGQCSADFSEFAGPIVHEHGEFFGDRHGGNLLASPKRAVQTYPWSRPRRGLPNYREHQIALGFSKRIILDRRSNFLIGDSGLSL